MIAADCSRTKLVFYLTSPPSQISLHVLDNPMKVTASVSFTSSGKVMASPLHWLEVLLDSFLSFPNYIFTIQLTGCGLVACTWNLHCTICDWEHTHSISYVYRRLSANRPGKLKCTPPLPAQWHMHGSRVMCRLPIGEHASLGTGAAERLAAAEWLRWRCSAARRGW
jgi:hypothetical protein